MPVTITHSTPADGTFSATGAAAWDASHSVSGLGTMAEQNSNNVNITGGSITGVTGVLTGLTVNSTPTSGGAAGQIMFDTGSVLQESSNLVWDNTNKKLTITGATVTTSQPVLDMTQTWNNAGATFTGLKFNVTNTASTSGSYLLDFQIGGSSKYAFRNYTSGPYIVLNNDFGWIGAKTVSASNIMVFSGQSSGADSHALNATYFYAGSDKGFGWAAGAIASNSTVDTLLTRRGAANLRFGAADAAAPVAQTLSVQSVVAGTSNTAGANLTITGSQGTGTGAGGSIIFQVAPAGSTGTAQNALSTALTLAPSASGGGRIAHVAGILADLTNAFSLTATMPATTTAVTTAVNFSLTGAGSSAQQQIAFGVSFLAGYTGASPTAGLSVNNANAGTDASYAGGGSTVGYRPLGNRGGVYVSNGASAGLNTGVVGHAASSTTANYGVWGGATFAVLNSWNIGVAGFGLNTTTNTQQIGGFFALYDGSTAAPNLATAALVADNGSQSAPVFLARVNGATTWRINTVGDAAWGSSGDAVISRRGAANLRFGAADAAAPVAQTLSVQSVVAGTSNTAGANLTITGSQGTGTGAGGDIIFQVAPAGSTGTAQNSLVTTAAISNDKRIIFYNSFTDAANYERLSIYSSSNIFKIATGYAGTGSARSIQIYTNGGSIDFGIGIDTGSITTYWRVLTGSGGHFVTPTDNTYDIGAATTTRPRNIYAATSILATGSTATIGYGTGSGGAVTQSTSRATGVTLNKSNGQITLVSAAGTTSWQSFTVTNSTVANTDTIIVNQDSGTDKYQIFVTNVAAGSFEITFATTGGTTTEQPVFNFAVIKAVTA